MHWFVLTHSFMYIHTQARVFIFSFFFKTVHLYLRLVCRLFLVILVKPLRGAVVLHLPP